MNEVHTHRLQEAELINERDSLLMEWFEHVDTMRERWNHIVTG